MSRRPAGCAPVRLCRDLCRCRTKTASRWQSSLLHHFANPAEARRKPCLTRPRHPDVQREVADRVAAKPGTRDYGLLSVTVQMYGPAEKLFTLPLSPFRLHDVHSTVFRCALPAVPRVSDR